MSTILVKSKTSAFYTDGVTVTVITDVDYPALTVAGSAFLDKRWFVCTPAGLVYQSADSDPSSWAALEFVGATTEPDNALFICSYKDYVMVLKEWSIEFFYDAANATGSILAPVRNMFQFIGCAHESSVAETAGTVVWMGQTKDGFGRSIYRMAEGSPQRISTVQVDKILDGDALSSVSSWTAKLGSHEFYGINLSSTSLVFDLSTGIWSVFTYLTASGITRTITAIDAAGVVTSAAHGYSNGAIIKVSDTNASWDGWHVITERSTNSFAIQGTGTAFSGTGTFEAHSEGIFPIKHSVSVGGKQIMQADGVLFSFLPDQATDEIGAIATRIRTVKFDGGTAKEKTISEAELIGDKIDSTALIRYSDDDYSTFSKFRPVDLSLERSRVRRLGSASRRGFEILHVGDALIRLEALEIEVG